MFGHRVHGVQRAECEFGGAGARVEGRGDENAPARDVDAVQRRRAGAV